MRPVALIVLIVLATSPAHADWQFTKWGMTQEEVIAAGGPEIVSVEVGEREKQRVTGGAPTLKMRYESGRYEFNVYFIFGDRDRKLMQVRSVLRRGGNCDALYQTLRQKYGEKNVIERLGRDVIISTWRDEEAGNEVALVQAGECTIVYSPLSSSDTEGL